MAQHGTTQLNQNFRRLISSGAITDVSDTTLGIKVTVKKVPTSSNLAALAEEVQRLAQAETGKTYKTRSASTGFSDQSGRQTLEICQVVDPDSQNPAWIPKLSISAIVGQRAQNGDIQISGGPLESDILLQLKKTIEQTIEAG